ncbi:MAG: DUF1592 domain-containing protein [Steroidobacteraceae bacterium]
MRLPRWILAGMSVMAGCAWSMQAAQGANAAHAQVPLMSVAGQKAFVERYCTKCHNPEDLRGDLLIDDLDLEQPGTTAELAEKVIRRVGVKMMPPPGSTRPDEASMRSFLAGLAANVDAYAAEHAVPVTPPLHRMNRTEYANSVRDLLGISIDADKLLPGDDFSQGFDNMADVLNVSPTLMEAYVRAAGRISRQALGDPDATPLHATYKQPRVVSQMGHIDGTPIGTRGGISVVHDFPAEGDYTFRVTFYQSIEGVLFGAVMGKTQQIEVSINGERAAVFPIDPAHTSYDLLETPAIHVKAGPQRISAAFLVNGDGPLDDAVQPVGFSLIDLNQATFSGLTTLPHLHEMVIGGPLKVTGVSDTPSRRRVFSCYPRAAADQDACARQILGGLATQAWRRKVGQAEVAELMRFYADGKAGGNFDSGIGVGLQAILASPNFIYRFEHLPPQALHAATAPGAESSATSHQVSDLELASRLSYFLWSSAPDDKLLQVAFAKKLHGKAVLREQVLRMLKDPRSIALSETFASQWLRLQGLQAIQPDGYLYPMYDKMLGEAMRRETVLLFDSIVRGNQPVLTLLDARYTFVNERLAALYGIPNVLGNRFRRVAVTDENRFGLLGHASILALTSASNRTSPVMRGKYVLQTLLGSPPPPPPPDVPALTESSRAHGEGHVDTVRSRLEDHRSNPNCAGCHKYIDGIGFALEKFDPIGARRGYDAGVAIDTTGELFDGTPLGGPVALRQALIAHSDDFLNTFVEALFAYGTGRVLRPADMPVVRSIRRSAAAQDNTFASFVLGIVESEPFRMRSVSAQVADEDLVARTP